MVYDLNDDGTVDRGEHPKNAGDRGYGHGDEITFELDSLDPNDPDVVDGELPKGYFVDLDGDGTVSRAVVEEPAGDGTTTGDYVYAGDYDAVLKHSAEVGDEVTVHLRGAQRVAEPQKAIDSSDTNDEYVDADYWPVLDTYDEGDELIALR